MTNCTFTRAWIGHCGKPDCTEHAAIKCCSCGNPATHECGETYGFVCGAPLCEECGHQIAEDGTNGGRSVHCRRDQQKHLPWYMRDEGIQSPSTSVQPLTDGGEA